MAQRSKRIRIGGLFLCLCVLLSGCSATERDVSANEAPMTLPPAESRYTAPLDDNSMTYGALVNLSLPSRDGQRLLSLQRELTLIRGQRNAGTVLNALFTIPSSETTRSLGGRLNLQLSGAMPVELSGDVCTVHLSSAAVALEYDELYTAALAIVSTLAGTSGVRYLNLMIAEQTPAFDVAGNLPAGSVTVHPGEELPALWDQMAARRTTLGENASQTPLSATATIFFPLADRSGFIPETRNLTFPGQTPAQLASGLLSAMSSGAQYLEGTITLPDITNLLSLPPEIAELPEGGRMISLYFPSDLESILDEEGIDYGCFVAAVTWTLTTFIPSVGAIRFFTGSTLLTALSSPLFGSLAFENGLIRRRQFRTGLRDQTVVALQRGGKLTDVRRSVTADGVQNPRTLLELLMAGPTEPEQREGIRATLPLGLDSTDILGIGVEDGVLLLNLSPRFERLVRQLDPEAERLCCYAMITTLCDALEVSRVRFFWNGEAAERLGGEIYWGGEFMLNHSIKESR